MTNSSLKSRRNSIGIVFVVSFLLLLLIQSAISLIVSASIPGVTQELSSALGHNLSVEKASFSFIKGVQLRGISIFYNKDEGPSVSIRNACVYAKIIPLFFKRLIIRKINVNNCILMPKKEKEGINLQIIFSDLYKELYSGKVKPLKFNVDINNLSINVNEAKVAPQLINIRKKRREVYLLFKNTRIAVYKTTRVRFRSEAKIKYQIPAEKYISRFLKAIEITQDLKCSMQGNIINRDFSIDMLLLNLREEQVVCTGVIKDFAERNPLVNISSVPTFISLEKIEFLRKNTNPQGHMFISIALAGAMDNIRINMRGNLNNCSFKYFLPNKDSVEIKILSGNVEFKNDFIKFDNISLKFNALPLNINLKTNISETPDIFLTVSVIQDFLSARGVPIENLSFSFKGKLYNTLRGQLEIKTLYKRKKLVLDMQAIFYGMDFDYYNPKVKYFKADKIELIKRSIEKVQKLNFSNFQSKVDFSKDHLIIKDVNFTGYKGSLTGAINLDFAKRKPQLSMFLKGLELDVKTLMQDVQVTGKLYSGIMDLRLRFDNYLERFVEGRCYIRGGVIDLETLSDVVKFPPLNNINFEIMHVYFAILKEQIIARGIKLSSSEIKINAFWDMNRKVLGVFNVKVNADFLKKSPQFKKLLQLTKLKEPYINFRFLLGGIPEAVRYMWMKSEFKNKLQEALPQGIIKSIEANLDKSIDELSNK